MPRYFFDLTPGPPVDAEGEDLPDDAAAMEAARQTVLEMVRDGLPERSGNLIEIGDAGRRAGGDAADSAFISQSIRRATATSCTAHKQRRCR